MPIPKVQGSPATELVEGNINRGFLVTFWMTRSRGQKYTWQLNDWCEYRLLLTIQSSSYQREEEFLPLPFWTLSFSSIVQAVDILQPIIWWGVGGTTSLIASELLTKEDSSRADKGWTMKRARRSQKVWCSGLGLLEKMSPVFKFGRGLWCGFSIRHCCH